MNILKNTLRAGVVALALGGTALVSAAPAQAAQPNISFQLNFGNGMQPFPHPGGNMFFHFGDKNYFKYCLTDRQVLSGLRGKGYSFVKIVGESRKTDKVYAVGLKNGSWYQFRVDRCTGKVDKVQKVKRRANGNFSLSFSF